MAIAPSLNAALPDVIRIVLSYTLLTMQITCFPRKALQNGRCC